MSGASRGEGGLRTWREGHDGGKRRVWDGLIHCRRRTVGQPASVGIMPSVVAVPRHGEVQYGVARAGWWLSAVSGSCGGLLVEKLGKSLWRQAQAHVRGQTLALVSMRTYAMQILGSAVKAMSSLGCACAHNSDASYRLRMRLVLQPRKSPRRVRGSLSLFLRLRNACNNHAITHHNVGNRLPHFLHRLRQSARRKRRKEECHLDLCHLRRDLQRYASVVAYSLHADADQAYNADTSSKTVVTHSKPTAFPSALRAKRSEVQTINDDDVQTTSVIQHTCEKCGREEVRYYTQQLRSADEGSTVFYECDCGNKYVNVSSGMIELQLILHYRWNTNN